MAKLSVWNETEEETGKEYRHSHPVGNVSHANILLLGFREDPLLLFKTGLMETGFFVQKSFSHDLRLVASVVKTSKTPLVGD